jgi:hypothetical protein
MADYGQFLLMGMYSGFPDVASASSALRLSVDALEVSYGSLTPGLFARAQSQLVVNSNIPAGYGVYILQDKPLQLASLDPQAVAPLEREVIGRTVGDAGTCTTTTAATWDNPDVSGTGYTAMGVDAAADFAGGSKSRQLPSMSEGEMMVRVAGDTNTAQLLVNRLLAVQYQVAVSPSNEAGVYTNAMMLTVIPNF